MTPNISILLLIVSLAALSNAAFIQPLSRTPLRPFSVNQNYTTDYSFSFYIPSAIPFQAFIEVEFPLPYDIPSACKAYMQGPSNSFNQYSCEKNSPSTYFIDVGQLVSGNYQLVLGDIQNPAAYLASSNLKIRTYFNKNILVDANEYFDAVPLLDTPVISTNGVIQNLGFTTVGLGAKLDVTFTLQKGINAGDSIKFNFPEGFYFKKPACFHKNSGSYTTAEVLYNNRMLICQAFEHAMEAKISQTVSIIGIVNPNHSGYFFGSSLETMEGVSPNIMEKVSVPSPILVQPGSLTVNVYSTSLYLAINTTHQFDLLFENDVPAGSQIWLKIPSGFRYLAPNCTLQRPLEAQENEEVTCGLAANNTGYILQGFSDISSSQLVSILVNVENPSVSANYKVDVFSYSTEYQAKIDEATATIAINSIYGSSRFFASHSLQFTRRLEHGETGALEFTFFLNIPLPATTSALEGGKIVVDIRPQIPTPPVGNLACFFYNTIPASTCTWDVSDSTKTRLTIGTPTTAPYFQTEIPITITTQDAVGTYGIQLPELIQRYKFYFYFYKNTETDFHEVYYEDYVPDPITLTTSDYTAMIEPLQYGQEAYLRVSWTNNYLALGTNYFFEIDFDHTNQAWDYNLGWPAMQWYETLDLPCIAENLGNNTKCVLTPGGAAGTSSKIQVIGLSAIPLGQTFTLHFPKIKFGTGGTAYLNFTLYQNTPGENTHKIPIVTTPILFQPNPSQTYVASAFDTLTVVQNRPDVDATLTFSFASTQDPELTIYEYPYPFVLASGEVACGTNNKCYAFADPANWIVFQPNPLQGTTTSTSLTIHTPPYSGTFEFAARTEKNGIVQDSKDSNFTVNPGPLTVTFAPSASNTEVNSNSYVLFDLTFITATKLPANASISAVFTQLTLPDRDDFYCLINSGLTGMDFRNVICQRMSATTIKIFNVVEVPAGTQISVTVQLQTGTTAAVTARVRTYYERNQTHLVDTGLGQNTLTFQYDNFQSSSIINNRYGDKLRVNSTGIINIQVTPTGSYSGATLIVTFGSDFSVGKYTDVLLCRVAGIRRRCTYTMNPLVVTITGVTSMVAGTEYNVSISSDFSEINTLGVLAPSTAGWHSINIAIVRGTTQEQLGDFVYVYPAGIPQFLVTAAPATAGAYAMYTFNILLQRTLTANTNTNTKGRIFIDFPAGDEGFEADLGTGLRTGEYVGCNIAGLTNRSNIHCRLWHSQGNGLPASVEVVGFDAVTSPTNTPITIRVARIKNPIVTAGEYVFTLRTSQVNLNTNLLTPRENADYSLWFRMINYTGTQPTYNAPNGATFQAGAAPGQTGTTLNINLYNGRALAAGDYFVFELPTTIKPDLDLTCPAGVSLCLSFQDCNWVVYQLSTALPATTSRGGNINTVTIPSSLDPAGYSITAYTWRTDQYDSNVLYNIDPSTYNNLPGNIAGKALTVNANQLVRDRIGTEFYVEFTPSVPISLNGTIEIRFPTGFTPQPNCKNSPSTGSGLTSSTGRIACSSVGTSWYITNFDNVAANTPVKIYGLVDLPDTAGNVGNVDIYTWGNQAANLATSGAQIEFSTTGMAVTIANTRTLNLDLQPTVLTNENVVAQTNNYHPLNFDFTLSATQVTAASSIVLQVDGSTTGFQSTRTTGEPLICYFTDLDTGDIVACTGTSATANNILSFTLQPLVTLAAGTNYRATITTAFAASGNDGVTFPSTAQVYKASIIANNRESDTTFFEIKPSKFSSLTVKSYVITQSDENVIDISLTASRNIVQASRLIVELPTVFNATDMFDEDLGQGLIDGQTKLCDVVSSLPAGLTMSCFFQKGSRNAGSPASVVLYGFSSAFTQLRFAFTVNNPVTSLPTVIPLTIYTQTGTTAFTKTFYQEVEKAVVVIGAASTPLTGTQIQPTYSTTNLGTASQLTISMNLPNNLQMSDYYVIKTPSMGTNTGSFTTGTTIPNFGTADILILPKNQYIIIRPNAATANSGTKTATIPNVFTPGTPSDLSFSAIVTYFSLMSGSSVSYTAGAFTSLPNQPTVALSTTDANRNSLMTITLNTIFNGVKSVIINTGTRITVKDCYENINSQIQVFQCSVDQTNGLVFITLEDQTFSTATRSLIINVVSTNGAAGNLGTFSYYVYSTVETNPTVTTGRSYAATNVNTGITLANQAPFGVEPNSIQFVYVPYSEDRTGIVNGDLGDLVVGVTLANTINAGDQVTITLQNFEVGIVAVNSGDVTSRAAAIITVGGNSVIAVAQIAGGNTITFTVPAGTTLAAGSSPRFRITQIRRLGDNVGLTSRTTTTDTLQIQLEGSAGGVEASAAVVSFLTKNIDPNRAPIRIKFNLAAALPANTGTVTLTLPANEFNSDTTSNPVCYFRTYQNDLDFTEQQSNNCQVTGTLAIGWTITATTPGTLAANTNQELVVETDSATNPYFDLISSTNQQMGVAFTSGATNIAGSILNLYVYEATPLLQVSNFYYTSPYAADPNTLILQITTNAAIPIFPSSLVELELSSATGSIIQTGQTATQRNITCGIVTLNARGASVAPTRCVIVNSSPPKVRIENYAAIANGASFYLMLYDLNDGVIAQDYVGTLNAKLIYTNNNNGRQSQHQMTRMFTSRTGTIAGASITNTFPTSSSLIYNTATTLSKSITWAAGDSCTNCRFIVRGLDTDWTFPTGFTFSIDGNGQTAIVDTTNNIFVVLATTVALNAGTTYTFTWGGMVTPQSYQRNSGTIEMDFINNLALGRVYDLTNNYPNLVNPASTLTSIATCTSFGTQIPGVNGNVDCVLSVPLGTNTNIAALQIDFTNVNTAQFSEVYNYCDAYVSTGTASPTKGQLSCSRQDPSTNAARFFITGFNFVSGSRISFTFRARAMSSMTIRARVSYIGLSGSTYYTMSVQNNLDFSIASVLTTAITAPALFSVSNKYQNKIGASSTSPIRVGLDVNGALTAQGSVAVTIGAGYAIPTNTFPLCTIRSEADFGAPHVTQCSFATGTNAYTLNLLDALATGRYLVEITTLHQNQITQGSVFPANTQRTSLTAQVFSTRTTLVGVDLEYFAPAAPYMTAFTINPLNNRIPDYNTQFVINMRPGTAVAGDTTTSENIILIEFPTPLYDADLGASTTTFTADNLTYYNGMLMPSSFTTLGGNTQASLHYGTTSFPAQVIVSKETIISAITTNLVSLSYIKNPGANEGLIIRVRVINYAQNQYYPTVLYEHSYINYFNTITPIAEISPPVGLSFSTLYPYSTATMTLSGKNYQTDINTNSEIYIKLKNQAAGFDYSSFSSVTCAGYTVDWHPEAYIFYLTPLSDVGTTPTIVCTGFVIGVDTDAILVETGVYKSDYGRIVASTNTSPPGPKVTTLNDLLTITRMGNNTNNVESVNFYMIQYNSRGFKLQAGTSILLNLPNIVEIATGHTEYLSIYGLDDLNTQALGMEAVNVVAENGNLRISGYGDYDPNVNGIITIYLFLRNIAAGTRSVSLGFYDANNNLLISSSASSTFTVSATPRNVVSGSFGPLITDSLDVYWAQTYKFGFYLQPKVALSSTNSDEFIITLPTGFTMPTANQACKYSRDNGAHWIRSSQCSVTGTTVTIPLESGFDIQAADNVTVILTSDIADSTTAGLLRPSLPQIFTFNAKIRVSNQVVESVFLPLITYPVPVTTTARWYNRDIGETSIMSSIFTPPSAVQAADFYQLDLVTNDEIVQMFPNDLGQGSTERKIVGNCARNPNSNLISNNVNLNCYISPGTSTASPPIMARVTILNEKDITANNALEVFVAGIQNPSAAFPGGFVFSVMRTCRSDGLGCPIFRRRYYNNFLTSSAVTPAPMTVPTLDAAKPSLFENAVTTTYQLSLGNTLTVTDAIVFKNDIPNIELNSTCASPQGICINFPGLSWTFFRSNNQLAPGTRQISIVLDNGLFYDRTGTLKFEVDIWNSGITTQIFTSNHPNYAVMVPTLATVMTQADPAIQRIVRNFNNIFELSMSNIWRTDLVQRIIVNIPDTYAPIDDNYCMAGCNLDDISSSDYFLFGCEKTGDRQMLIVIDDTWTPTSETYSVTVFYRGFLPVNATTGLTNSSNITSYASMTLDWVVDENTNYSFVIDSVPTPIIRDLNLNLKSFYDRRASISDYVEFYAAVWPYTAYNANDPSTQVKSIVFQVDDAYTYPSISTLLCYMKVIMRETVDCTLKRSDGRTEIVVQMPADYQNGPFLIRITNTEEDLLFIAPDREGEFQFNMTMYNALGQVVEQDDSYMKIDGAFVSNFSAEPIALDPLVQTIYNIQFTTASRVTPQGFGGSTQSVSTQIVLQFQSYDPAFPIDLGTGLANNSEVSCVPVKGITVTQTGKLTCTLIYGIPNDPILIIVTGYDAIPVNTAVQIYIDQISTLALGASSRIKLEIQSQYSDSPNMYVFYDSLDMAPLAPTASIARTPATMTVAQTGSLVLKEASTYTFTFATTSALVANRDFIVIYFPDYGYELDADYSNVMINITSPSVASSGYVMPLRNVIYIQPTAALAAGSTQVTIQNLPNPAYSLSGSFDFTVQTIVNNKTLDVFTTTFNYTSTTCDLFDNVKITYSSSYTRINENTYQITFEVEHDVPATGSLAVIFDSSLYNLRPSHPQCEIISGLSSDATCGFEYFFEQLVRIHLNGEGVTAGTTIKLNVINVNNPIDSTQTPVMTIKSYFDDEFGTTKMICAKNISLPNFLPLSLVNCPVQIQPEINNAGQATDYLITMSCSTSIRNATLVAVTFPDEYQFLSNLSCSTNGNYMLTDCTQVPRTNQINILIFKPNIQLPLILRVRGVQNPPYASQYGPFNVSFSQYDVLYAQLDSAKSSSYVNISSNQDLIVSSNILALSVFPRNYGEKATYYFNLLGLQTKKTPDTLEIRFDKSFANDLGTSLECGTFTPQGQFGENYALNYEQITDLRTFSCQIVDNQLLSIELSPTIQLSTTEVQDLFFYVKNVVNPSMSQQSLASSNYIFEFTFIQAGTAVITSTNIVSIQYALPPSLLEITDLANSDINMNSPSNYTFTFASYYYFPLSNVTSDYEILLKLPSDYYTTTDTLSEMAYSFPDNQELQDESEVFKFQDQIYIYADYPPFTRTNPISIAFYNMTNPPVESQCGINAQGIPVKFEAQYVSREQGFVYGKTYQAMDQHNCLPLTKERRAISVYAPLYMRKGLMYQITVQVEEAASDLQLTPISNFLIFEPKTISFNDYVTKETQIQVLVSENVAEGEYTITWQKVETSNYTRYLDVDDTKITVVAGDTSPSLAPAPSVRVEEIRYVWTGKIPRDVTVTLDQEAADQLILQIDTKVKDSKLQGSPDGIASYDFPISVSFGPGETQKTFFVYADQGAQNNALVYTLQGTNALAFNQIIPNTPFIIKTQLGISNFQIFSTQQFSITENEASYLVSLSDIGSIYFMAVSASTVTPTLTNLIQGTLANIDSRYYKAGKVEIERITDGSSISTFVNFTGLQSQTKYQVYVVARSYYGEYTAVTNLTMTTAPMSGGVNVLIPTYGEVDVDDLIEALSVVIPLDKDRIILSGTEIYPLESVDPTNPVIGTQINEYRITIAPDPFNNSPTPMEIAQLLLTAEKQAYLASLVPELYQGRSMRITPVEAVLPRFMTLPSSVGLGYYALRLNLELIEAGKVYAIVTETSLAIGNIKPTSYQIANGLLANNTKLDERYVKKAYTDEDGNGVILFDELKDYTIYNIYITAGSNVPYEPSDLLADADVIQLKARTLKNPNVGTQFQSYDIYRQFYGNDSPLVKPSNILMLVIIALTSIFWF